MLLINFLPDSDRADKIDKINKCVAEYKNIWEEDGRKIVEILEKYSGLKFIENKINAIVFISGILPSRSFPLSLQAHASMNLKKGTLVHELCHRLLSGNGVRIKAKKYKDLSLEIHKVLNLMLYDCLIDLYGTDVAEETVAWESKSRTYKKAWEWALSKNKKERNSLFKTMIAK